MRRFLLATVLALAGGLLLAAAFPPNDALRPLALAGPLLLALALREQRARTAYLLTFIFAMAFFIPQVAWTGTYLGPLPWFALAIYQSVIVAFMGPALVAVRRLPAWPVFAACVWVADEAIRSRWLFGGFPWGRLAFSQAAGPFTPYVAFGGVPLLSGAVALCGFLLARTWESFRANDHKMQTLRILGTAAMVPILGTIGWLAVPTGKGAPTETVAIVQGNVPVAGLDFNARPRAVLDDHVKETHKLAEQIDAGTKPRPVLVVWPENSSDIDPYLNDDASTEIQAAADEIKAPILVGAVVEGPGDNDRNMAIMWWPKSGPGMTYVKRHPAPFAEYIPDRAFFSKIAPMVNDVLVDFAAGKRIGTFTLTGQNVAGKPLVFGDVICFEIAYDSLVRDTVTHGAKFITVQTNNATFGRSDESDQQFAMSRIRAVEHDRSVLSASTTGVSGIIMPDGTVVAESKEFVATNYSMSIPIMSGLTIADRVGAIPEYLMCLAALVGIGWGFRRRRTTAKPPLVVSVYDENEVEELTAR